MFNSVPNYTHLPTFLYRQNNTHPNFTLSLHANYPYFWGEENVESENWVVWPSNIENDPRPDNLGVYNHVVAAENWNLNYDDNNNARKHRHYWADAGINWPQGAYRYGYWVVYYSFTSISSFDFSSKLIYICIYIRTYIHSHTYTNITNPQCRWSFTSWRSNFNGWVGINYPSPQDYRTGYDCLTVNRFGVRDRYHNKLIGRIRDYGCNHYRGYHCIKPASCGGGTFMIRPWSWDEDGFQMDYGECQKCTIGTFSNEPLGYDIEAYKLGSFIAEPCTPCAAGKMGMMEGETVCDTPCAKGFYCPEVRFNVVICYFIN